MTIRPSHARPRADSAVSGTEPVPTRGLVDSWAAAGLISPDQAEALKRDLTLRQRSGELDTRRPRPAVSSLVVEGLGYLGGVIIVAASVVLGATYWDDLSATIRVAAAGTAVAGLSLTALRVGARSSAAVRVRAVLLACAVVALGAFVGILAHELGMDDGLDVVTLAALGAAGYAALLWWRFPTLLQQATALVSLLVAVGCSTAQLGGPDGLPGVAVWAVGVVWMLLAWGGLLQPRQLAEALGAAAAVVGAMLTVPADAGNVLAIGTAVLVIAAALLVRNLLVLAIGAVGALQATAVAVTEWFPGRLAAPLVLLALGGALVGAAIAVARHRASRGGPDRAGSRFAHGSPRAAVLAACVVAVVSSCAIAVIGLL